MYRVSITIEPKTTDAETRTEHGEFPSLHEALEYIDCFIRDPDVWTIELWDNDTCVYTFAEQE